MAGVTGRLHVEALRSQDSSAVDESEGAGAGRVEGQDVEEGRPLANRGCGERSLEQALKLADDAFSVESILIRMKVDLEGEKKAVQELYDNCVAEDVFFYCGLTKESIWEGCFGPLYDASEQVNITCIARVYDRYGCLPSEISSKEPIIYDCLESGTFDRRVFMTSDFVAACAHVNQMISDLGSLAGRMKAARLSFGSQLFILPPGVGKLANYLERLNLSRNFFSTLPSELKMCKKLAVIDASNNRFTELPPLLFDLIALVAIDFSENSICTLPLDIGRWHSVKHINFMGNNITFVPDEIGECTKVEYLNLCNNNFTSLPKAIGQCKALKTIMLMRGGDLGPIDLPEEIEQLSLLEKFYASSTTANSKESLRRLQAKGVDVGMSGCVIS